MFSGKPGKEGQIPDSRRGDKLFPLAPKLTSSADVNQCQFTPAENLALKVFPKLKAILLRLPTPLKSMFHQIPLYYALTFAGREHCVH